MQVFCPICGSAGRACGDDHMALPPISTHSLGGNTMTDDKNLITSTTTASTEVEQAPQELGEYEYFVGHAKMSAQMTKEHAEAVGAKPVGELGDSPDDPFDNKNAERLGSQMAKSDTDGVKGPDADALDKARTVRNRRA